MKLSRYHIPYTIFLLQLLVHFSHGQPKSVYVFKSIVGSIRQIVTSSVLAWETFVNEEKQLSFGVVGGIYYETPEQKYKIYVCRALLEGILVPGSTKHHDNTTVCIVSMHTSPSMHRAFEILVNRGRGAKLHWMSWSKFSGSMPFGSICTSDGHSTDTYVSRHKVHRDGHHVVGGDYIVGRFEPNNLLGKIFVNSDGEEESYEEGEILTEIEPVRYEIREVVPDKWRTKITRNEQDLGSTVLPNNEMQNSNVETIISYIYDKEEHWGMVDGMAKALPTKIISKDKKSGKETISEINWGLKHVQKMVATKTVSTELQAGTALNVTLKGNYTISEGPYNAVLTTYYLNSTDVMKRAIVGSVRKTEMLDVKIDFGPIYWIHNQTMVPTTTTTTTTSTTTTTEPTTTSTGEPKPIEAAPIDVIRDELDDNNIPADESREEPKIALGNIVGAHTKQEQKNGNNPGGAPAHFTSFSVFTLFAAALITSQI